jgi:hypothetical protein
MIPPSGTKVRWRTMTGLLDSAELRLVVLRVDVNVLRLSGALAVGIDRHLALPLGDVPIGILVALRSRRNRRRARVGGWCEPDLKCPGSPALESNQLGTLVVRVPDF